MCERWARPRAHCCLRRTARRSACGRWPKLPAGRPADGRVEIVPVEEARKTMGLFADALALDQQISGERARRLLGWQPQGPTVLEDLASGL